MRRNFRKKITRIIFVVAVCSVTLQLPAVEFAGGTGEPNAPYQIATAEQLQAIGDSALNDKCFILIADIDLDPNLPGNEIIIDRPFIPFFNGILDGNGHTISSLVININNIRRDFLGLIDFIGENGIIKDIELRNITIYGYGNFWGVLAGANSGMILRCSVTGRISSGGAWFGGLAGENSGDIVSCSAFCNIQPVPGEIVGIAGGLVGDNFGYIFNCHATGTVIGVEYLGGLVGTNGGVISNCYAIGNVNGKEYVGGLIGVNYNYISNSYAMGTITGEKYLGGLVGNNGDFYYSTLSVSQCYAACKTIADSNDSIGGLIGKSTLLTTDSFWDVQVSGQKVSAGGIGMSTAKLQDSKTYLDAGWDLAGETSHGLVDIWTIAEPNTYPQLTRFTDQYTVTQLSGSGTPDDPYEIATAAELVAINDHDINAHYALVADIDMSGMVWATAPILFFNGTFDGRGHTISNLTIKGGSYLGLFGNIGRCGIITNLTIQDACIVGHERIGILVGESFLGHITNCHATGSVTGTYSVGGLAGVVIIPCFTALEDYVSDCSADVILSSNDEVDNIANVDYYG